MSSLLTNKTNTSESSSSATEGAVLFETYSFLHLAVLWRLIRANRFVYFSRRVPLKEAPIWKKRLVCFFIRLLNRKADVREVPIESVSQYLWQLNSEAVHDAIELSAKISGTRAYQLIRRIVGDDNLVRYYQGTLVREIPNWRLFPFVARDISLQHASLTIVPEWDTIAVHTESCDIQKTPTNGDLLRHLPAHVRTLNRLRLLVKDICGRLVLLVVPTALLLTRLRHGIRLKPRGPYAVAMPVVYGVRDPEALTDGINRPHNDEYLYGGSLKPGDIVHVFGDWVFPKPVADGFRKTMEARGLHFVDKSRFGVDSRSLWLILKVQLTLLKVLWPYRGDNPLEYLVLKYSPKAVYYYLRKHLELGNVRFRVELVKNDYNPGHVINTIVCQQQGIKTVGVQHAALPCDAPQLAFVHMDEYVVYGNLYVKRFKKYWNGLKLQCTGRESIDWAVRVIRDSDRLVNVRHRWSARFPARRHNVLILFPGTREICLRRQWQRMYHALEAVSETGLDCNIILRFRTRDSLRQDPVRQFMELPRRDPRFIVELENFTTYELMALCDLVIAPEASFTVNEALAMGVVVFTFEYVGTAPYYFSDYGRDFVLRTRDDILRVFAALSTGFQEFDCRWDALRRDANYHEDGLNCHRMRAVVERAAGLGDLAPIEPSRTECSKVLL